MPSWNVTQYELYENERLRPALDLLNAIPITPSKIVDVGCGTGNVTAIMKDRWPAATVLGFDSSPSMIEKARSGRDDIIWDQKQIEEWVPEEKYDLIFSNAVYHWLPDHPRLFERLFSYLSDGGVFAAQMPNNFDLPTHTTIEEVARENTWSIDLEPKLLGRPVGSTQQYYDIFQPLASTINLWETHYTHVLSGDDPVTEWIKGSALRPILDTLDEEEKSLFLSRYRERIEQAYPKQTDGKTLLTYRRTFIVAIK
ncbi:MAG: methyltransferase domain-containing protein [Candidatus Kariarchaeaceae archaeon]